MDDDEPSLETVATTQLESLDEARLQRWISTALHRRKDPSLSWFERFRWRRQFSRLMTASARRTAARIPKAPALCQRCQSRPPTVDVIYGRGADERYAHFCDACYMLEPPGRFVQGRG